MPARGRRFVGTGVVRLGDVDRTGRIRFDGIARHLQDVATDDSVDSGLDGQFAWVVRRTLIDVRRPAVLNERLHLTTFCTGTGRCWAERRTSIAGDRGSVIETVSLWVQLDVATGRPATLDEGFTRVYGEASGDRRVSTRLTLPEPPPDADVRPWPIRVVDLDVFDHVNNASHWPILEEVIPAAESGRVGVAEMEYLHPVDIGSNVMLQTTPAEPLSAWLVAEGRVHSATRFTPR